MSCYDEDLSVNPFFVALQRQFPDLYQAAIDQGYTICVPRVAVSCGLLFTEKDFLNHIIKESPSGLVTLSGLHVHASRRGLATEAAAVNILFEETFYNEREESARLVCVSDVLAPCSQQFAVKPRAGTHRTWPGHLPHDAPTVAPITSLEDCIAVLWGDTADTGGPRRLRHVTDAFSKTAAQLAGRGLQLQLQAASTLFSRALQTVLKDASLRAKCRSNPASLADVKLAVETYVLHVVYHQLFANVAASVAERDARLNKVTRNATHVKPCQLGIREALVGGVVRGVVAARKEAAKLNTFSTPLGKLSCLRRIVSILSTSAQLSESQPPQDIQACSLSQDLSSLSCEELDSASILQDTGRSRTNDVVSTSEPIVISKSDIRSACIAGDNSSISCSTEHFTPTKEEHIISCTQEEEGFDGDSSSVSLTDISVRHNPNITNNTYAYSASFARVDKTPTTPDNLEQSDSPIMTSDDLLPLVVFLVMKSDVANWFANFTYMSRFRFSKSSEHDEFGFYLATLEAALEHITSGQVVRDNVMTAQVMRCDVTWPWRDGVSDSVVELFALVVAGDVAAVRAIFSRDSVTGEPQDPASEGIACHPLCACPTCRSDPSLGACSRDATSVTSQDGRGWSVLHAATAQNNTEMMEAVLVCGARVLAADGAGSTALHLACRLGFQAAALLLLHHKASSRACDTDGNTALHIATLHGHVECVNALVYYDQGATQLDMNARNKQEDTALHLAARWGYTNIVDILLENGAQPHVVNRRRQTPRSAAHNLTLARRLQQAMDATPLPLISPNVPSPSRQTYTQSIRPSTLQQHSTQVTSPSHDNSDVACVVGAQEHDVTDCTAPALLSVDAPLRQRPSPDSSPRRSPVSPEGFVVVPRTGPTEQDTKVKAVVGSGLPPEKRKVEKLVRASAAGDLPLVAFLLGWPEQVTTISPGTSPHVTGHQTCAQTGGSLCHPLCQCSQCGPLQYIVTDEGLHVNVRDSQGQSPLHVAALHGHVSLVQLLVAAGADVAAVTNEQRSSPLHLACQGHAASAAEVVAALVRGGCPLTARDAAGRTPLHCCAVAAHVATARALLQCACMVRARDAMLHARDTRGNTALHDVARRGHDTLVTLLLAYGASPHVINKARCRPGDLTHHPPTRTLLRAAHCAPHPHAEERREPFASWPLLCEAIKLFRMESLRASPLTEPPAISTRALLLWSIENFNMWYLHQVATPQKLHDYINAMDYDAMTSSYNQSALRPLVDLSNIMTSNHDAEMRRPSSGVNCDASTPESSLSDIHRGPPEYGAIGHAVTSGRCDASQLTPPSDVICAGNVKRGSDIHAPFDAVRGLYDAVNTMYGRVHGACDITSESHVGDVISASDVRDAVETSGQCCGGQPLGNQQLILQYRNVTTKQDDGLVSGSQCVTPAAALRRLHIESHGCAQRDRAVSSPLPRSSWLYEDSSASYSVHRPESFSGHRPFLDPSRAPHRRHDPTNLSPMVAAKRRSNTEYVVEYSTGSYEEQDIFEEFAAAGKIKMIQGGSCDSDMSEA